MRGSSWQTILSLEACAAGPNSSVDFILDSTKGDRRLRKEQMALIRRDRGGPTAAFMSGQPRHPAG
jgi:hypothetical protein